MLRVDRAHDRVRASPNVRRNAHVSRHKTGNTRPSPPSRTGGGKTTLQTYQGGGAHLLHTYTIILPINSVT